MPKVYIDEWDMSKMRSDRSFTVVGRRGTGKTTLLRNILFHNRRKVDVGIGIVGSGDADELMNKIMPKTHVYREMNHEKVEEAILCQKQLDAVQRMGSKKRTVYVILDDCAGDGGKDLKSPEMRNILANGRHYRMFFGVILQYLKDMVPGMRANMDYVFCQWDDNEDTRKKLYENFFEGLFPGGRGVGFRNFSQVFKTFTQKYGTLVLNNIEQSNDIKKRLFYYRSRLDLPEFTIGEPDFWFLYFKYAKLPVEQRIFAAQQIKKRLSGIVRDPSDRKRLLTEAGAHGVTADAESRKSKRSDGESRLEVIACDERGVPMKESQIRKKFGTSNPERDLGLHVPAGSRVSSKKKRGMYKNGNVGKRRPGGFAYSARKAVADDMSSVSSSHMSSKMSSRLSSRLSSRASSVGSSSFYSIMT